MDNTEHMKRSIISNLSEIIRDVRGLGEMAETETEAWGDLQRPLESIPAHDAINASMAAFESMKDSYSTTDIERDFITAAIVLLENA